MMNKYFCSALTVLFSLAAFSASADTDGIAFEGNCNVEFKSDLTIDPETIKVTSSGGNHMLINRRQELFVDGSEIDLDPETRALVAEYDASVRRTVPEIVAIALEGVEVGLTAVSEVFYAMSSKGPPESLLRAIDGIQEEISSRMYQDGETLVVKGGEIRGVESAMQDLEPALEDAISEAVGDAIVAVGESVKQGDGSLLERIAGFASKMADVEKNVEARVASKASDLKARAEGLCDQIYALQAAESQLQSRVPQARGFDIVKDA